MRPDGTRVKNASAIVSALPYIMPRRYDAHDYITEYAEMEPMRRYIQSKRREGVRISFNLDGGVNNAWFLLRLSVHDPVMPLNAESDVPGGVKTMAAQLLSVLAGAAGVDLSPLAAVAR